MNCKYCNTKFKSDRGTQKFCNKKCRLSYWIENNLEKHKNYQQSYRLNNKKKSKEYSKQYRKDNYENLKIKRRTRERNKVKTETEKTKNQVRKYHNYHKKKFGDKCKLCGSNKQLEIHHFKYTKKFEDAVLLCNSCHRKVELLK